MFEVRKIDSKGSTYEMLHIQTESSNEVDAYLEDDVIVEDNSLRNDEMTTDNSFSLEFAAKLAERSCEGGASVRLFVYGVRYPAIL